MSPLEFDLLKALARASEPPAVARAHPQSRPAARLGSVRPQRGPAHHAAAQEDRARSRASAVHPDRAQRGLSLRAGRRLEVAPAARPYAHRLLQLLGCAAPRCCRCPAACGSRRPRCGSAPTSGSAASRSTSRASSAASIRARSQLVEYPSASEVLRAFRNQAIDGMVISLDELFGLAVDGFQPRIVLVVDVSHGADVVVGRRGMRRCATCKGKSVAVESSALGAFVLSRALALNGMQAGDVNVVHLESNEQPGAFEKGQVDGAVTFDPYRAPVPAGGREDAVRQHADPGRDRRSPRRARDRGRAAAGQAVRALLNGWFDAIDYMKKRSGRRGAPHGRSGSRRRASSSRKRCAGCTFRRARRTCGCCRRPNARAGGHRPPADGADGELEAPAVGARDRARAGAGAAAGPVAMNLRVPASLKVTVPLILLVFAAMLSAVNLLYHVPQAEREAEEDGRKRLAEEMSRLQSTLEYMLLKGDREAAQHEIAVLAHNHDVLFATLTDDRDVVIASTRRAWLGRPIEDVFPQLWQSGAMTSESRAGMTIVSTGDELLGRADLLVGTERDDAAAFAHRQRGARLRPQALQGRGARPGGPAVAVLGRLGDGARAGDVARLPLPAHAAYGAACARGGRARGRQPRRAQRSRRTRTSSAASAAAFDAMALVVANTQIRLRHDIEERVQVQKELEASEASYRSIFDAAEDSIFVHDPHSGAIVDVNPKACATFGYTREEFRQLDDRRAGDRRAPVHAAGRNGADRAGFRGRAAPDRVARPEQGRHAALARGLREARRHRRQGPDPGAGTRHRPRRSARRRRSVAQRESLYQREKLAALGSLLAGVAHELNNPLSVVVARAVLLEEQGNPGTQAAATKIRSAAERCARIVRTFLAMARQQQPERGPVPLNDVVTAALDITGYAVRTSSIDVIARSRRRHPADPCRRRPAAPGAAQPHHQRAAVAAGTERATPNPGDEPLRRESRRRARDSGRQWPWHTGGRPRAGVRALLHDQADRRRARRRPGGEPRHRRSARRDADRRLPGRGRRGVHDHAAGRRSRRQGTDPSSGHRGRRTPDARSSSSTTSPRSAKCWRKF